MWRFLSKPMRAGRSPIHCSFMSEGQRSLLGPWNLHSGLQIRGRADAKATSVYAAAYNKSAAARELYGFSHAMEALEKSFDDKTSLILTTDSELYRYLKKIK